MTEDLPQEQAYLAFLETLVVTYFLTTVQELLKDKDEKLHAERFALNLDHMY